MSEKNDDQDEDVRPSRRERLLKKAEPRQAIRDQKRAIKEERMKRPRSPKRGRR